MTYFCWFWLFCWRQHDNMIIYSFYVWFFNSSYWVLPVFQISFFYDFSIKSYRGWLNPPPPPPPGYLRPKKPGSNSLIGLTVNNCNKMIDKKDVMGMGYLFTFYWTFEFVVFCILVGKLVDHFLIFMCDLQLIIDLQNNCNNRLPSTYILPSVRI